MLKGERLDKPTYAVLKSSVGGGANGEVVVASHGIFGTRVVQKTVSLLGVSDSVARSEPARLESFDHPNIIDISEAQWTPEMDEALRCVTFVSPLYEGRCIHTALMEGHEFGVAGTISVAEGILSALVYLHDDRKILHRDIKPANIMLDALRVHAYVGDLGSAAELDPTTGMTDYYGGTPLYRPPEAASNALDVRSDLYGVGAVMVEMLNGPHDYAEINFDNVDKRISQGRRALPDAAYVLKPWVPPQLTSIVRKLIATKAEDRFESAYHARRALQNVQCVMWTRVGGEGLVGTWTGTFPPHVAPTRSRVYEVSASPVTAGKYKGQVRLSARWRRQTNLAWRNYAVLARRVELGDEKALASFFRDVEARAHSAPAA